MKQLGIWMDHSNAHLMEFTKSTLDSKTIISDFTSQDKEHSLAKSEKLMHNKEQHKQAEYFKKLAKAIRNYNEVLLFGPTEAKSELFNLLKSDHLFSNIRIEVKQTDHLTENQQHAFVKDYFTQNK